MGKIKAHLHAKSFRCSKNYCIYDQNTSCLKCPYEMYFFSPWTFSHWLNLLSINLVSIFKSEFCHFYIDLYIQHLYSMYHYFSV